MAETPDPQELAELESELKECARQGDSLEALDIYDELDAKGWIKPRHLLGMGHCFIKLRRKQDARESWIRAYSMDPAFQEAVDVLDELFPGWKRATPPPPKSAPAAAPAPEPAPPPAPVSPPPAAAAVVRGDETREAPAYQPPSQSTPAAAAAEAGAALAQAVNWGYVLADVEEASHALERTRREAASTTADEKMPEFSINMTPTGTPAGKKRGRGKK